MRRATRRRLDASQARQTAVQADAAGARPGASAPWLPADGPARGHAFDGGRSRAIRQGLEPLLDEVREAMSADVALALHVSGSRIGVLATAGGDDVSLPLVNEEVRCTDAVGRQLSFETPRLLQDVVLASRVRRWGIELSSAVAIPWAGTSGRGIVLLGVIPGRWLSASLELAGRYRQSFEATHRDASYRGTMRLAEDLAAACRAVDRAELETTESGELLANIAAIARGLLGTSTAYIAMAEGSSGAFPFATLVGIRTSSFRRLRMAHDQGLGGLARRERATVRTMDYSRDCRLQSAPVAETREEGIISAMCAPLVMDGAIQGSLYIGDRQLRAFSETDVELLDAFASHASLLLRRQHVEEHRLSVLRHRERERLAAMLHDSVVRSLVEIGYHAHEGRLSTTDSALHGVLEEIGAAAGATLEALRGELASLDGSRSREREGDPCAGELVEALRLLPRRPDVTRTFELLGLAHETELPERLLDALISVGEEAISNAEHHSGCTTERITLERSQGQLRLRIVDDGRGLDVAAAESALADGSGHLGMRSMRTETRALGGYTRVIAGDDGRGTEVIAVVPCLSDGHIP